MIGYVLRRLLQLVPVMFLVATAVFFVFRVVPGDIAVVRLGLNADPDAVRALREALGLNRPILLQYFDWLGRAVRGDLGTSYIDGQPVLPLVLRKLATTAEIALLGTLLSVVLSIPAGIIAALRRGTWADHVARFSSIVGFSTPRYWLAVLLILFFSVQRGWLPVAGYVEFFEAPIDHLRHVTLPVISIALTLGAVQMRFLRSSLLDVLGQDYIRTAHAKGLPTRTVVRDHALKNALIPFTTVVGLALGGMLGGLVVVEQIFSWPGIGWLIVQSITHRDYEVVQGAVLVVAISFVMINLIVDVAYAYLDPRIEF